MPKVTEAHVEARRTQILHAACKCFSDKGFQQTTIRDICDRSGLSAGAVYGYFKSKDEILEAVAELGRESTRAALGVSHEEPEPPSLADILGTVMRLADSGKMRDSARLDVRMWGEALHTPQLRKVFLEALANVIEPFTDAARRGQETGDVSRHLDAEAIARVCLALVLGFTAQIAIEPDVDYSGCSEVVSSLLDGSFTASARA